MSETGKITVVPKPMPTSTTEPPATNNPPANDDPFATQREQVRQEALREAASAYNPALQDAERRATEAQRRVAELEARANKQDAPKSDPTQFLANPQEEVTRIVKRELAEQIAPLNQFAAQFQNQNIYGQIKAQLRVNPQMSAILPQVEAYLDQEYTSLNPLNPGAVAALATMIFGQIQAGFRPPLVAPVQPNSRPNLQLEKPLPNPSLPPSPPKILEPPKATIELTEQQRRVARINGMTDEQYIAWMNSSGIITEDRKIGAAAS